ncbi:Succinyl-3-ketoacid-coenzyme a transferase [Paramyrothecium foliicola]|nr:Succinyl-3-ketoacid-coenzyme a transferase [Paramyrothecium foliicola]
MFDQSSGVVYKEWTLPRHSFSASADLDWSRKRPYPLFTARGVRGPRSLVDMATNVIANNIGEVTDEMLDAMPLPVVWRIWRFLEARGVCLHAWKLFSRLLLREEDDKTLGLYRFRQHICRPDVELKHYVQPMSCFSADFITHLVISGGCAFSTHEMLCLAEVRNLGVLEIVQPADELRAIFPQVSDGLLRGWTEFPEPFPLLRILRIWGDQTTTQDSLHLLAKFPSLVLYDVMGSREDWATPQEEGIKTGWELAQPVSGLEDSLLRYLMLFAPLEETRSNRLRDLSRSIDGDLVSVCGDSRCAVKFVGEHEAPPLLEYFTDTAKGNVLVWDPEAAAREARACHGVPFEAWAFWLYSFIGQMSSNRDLENKGVKSDTQAVVGPFVLPSKPMACLFLGHSGRGDPDSPRAVSVSDDEWTHASGDDVPGSECTTTRSGSNDSSVGDGWEKIRRQRETIRENVAHQETSLPSRYDDAMPGTTLLGSEQEQRTNIDQTLTIRESYVPTQERTKAPNKPYSDTPTLPQWDAQAQLPLYSPLAGVRERQCRLAAGGCTACLSQRSGFTESPREEEAEEEEDLYGPPEYIATEPPSLVESLEEAKEEEEEDLYGPPDPSTAQRPVSAARSFLRADAAPLPSKEIYSGIGGGWCTVDIPQPNPQSEETMVFEPSLGPVNLLGGKHFSRDLQPIDAEGNQVSMWSANANNKDDEEDDDDDEESSEEEEDDDDEKTNAAGPSNEDASREDRKAQKKARKEAAIAKQRAHTVEVGDLPSSDDEDDDDDMPANPNHSKAARKQATNADVEEITEGVEKIKVPGSRREREAMEAAAAKERYMKLHAAGKTDEAKADLARLKVIREQRAAESARRQAEKEEREEKEKERRAEIEAKEAKKRAAAAGPKKGKKA